MMWMSRAKRLAVASSKQRKLLTLNPWSIFEVILISLYSVPHCRHPGEKTGGDKLINEGAKKGVILENSKHYKTS